jgi:hypothetical protein
MARPPATGPGTRACARATARPRGARLQPGRGGPPVERTATVPPHTTTAIRQRPSDDDDPIFGDCPQWYACGHGRQGIDRYDAVECADHVDGCCLPFCHITAANRPAVNPLAMLDPHARLVHGVQCAEGRWRALVRAAVKFAGNFAGPR